MLATQTIAETGRELANRLFQARQQSDALFGVVRSDFLYERPIPQRHRIVFYIGHLEAFDWNLLAERVFGLKSAQPELDRLFAFGIDPVNGGLPADVPSDWPALDHIRRYVSRSRMALDEKLTAEALAYDSPACDGFPLRTLLHVAIEHRLMHLETLAYMLHQLPLDQKNPQADPPAPPAPPVANRMIPIPAGSVTLGLPRDSETFGWDNEFVAHTADVGAFEIDAYKVTNQQYLEFITAGGYDGRAFWNDDDWSWKTQQGIYHPVFWKRDGGRWFYRTMFAELPLPLDWPVYVSHAEAQAYARWAGKSLPSESEWQRAAYGNKIELDSKVDLNSSTGNFDFRRWNPVPVNTFPRDQNAFGAHGMVGNGWEWTSTHFDRFPGFEPFPFYRGYSADFFDGTHFVMKGGSARTAECMLRPSFRNWFQPHYQYVYAGFRCVSR
ncbi:MAG: SUMF1/EgtB/PvdO family nonheme iron enzyme [Candidatus Sulfotelmatobacter sp.]